MTENKKSAKSVLPAILSCVLVLISCFIYNYLPESDIANSIENPAMTAVYIMITAPVLCVAALVLLVYCFKKNRAELKTLINGKILFGLFGISAIFDIVSLIFEIIFIISLFKLGFAAPVDGTVYETYGNFILISSILQILGWVFMSLKIKGSAKK